MIVRAYAKVNLSLKILGKRDDGYHILESRMQALPELYDILEITEANETKVTCSDESLNCGEDNLVCKALKLLGKNAKVHIEKHIPIAAGLAGGSADAAAVLFAFGGTMEDAAKLGADVPFSLLAIRYQGKVAAMASGIGTELRIIDRIENKIITKTPNVAVPTKLVYEEYDKMHAGQKVFGPAAITNARNIPLTIKDFANDLQAPAIKLFPVVQEYIDKLKKPHPQFGKPILVAQSGSGPTVFAIYEEENK